MSLKKLGGETIIYGLSSILGRLLNFVVATYFLTQLMGREEFGVVGELMFYTAFLIAFLVFRMDTVVFRFASREEYDPVAVFRKAQRWVMAAAVIVIGTLLLLSQEVADWLSYPDRVSYVWLVLVTVGFDALSAVPLARLRLEQRPWFFVAVNIGNVLLNILLFFLLLYGWRLNNEWTTEHWGLTYNKDYQVGYYLLCITLAAAFRYGLLLIDGLYHYGRKQMADERGAPLLKTFVSYSLPLTVVAIAGITNFLIAPAIIKYYHGGTVTENLAFSGDFNAATKLAVLLNLFVTAYNYAAEPFFFRQAGKDLKQADLSIYANAARAYSLIAAVASAGILLFLPWLQVLIAEDNRGGLYILPVLLAANFFFGLYANLSVAYKLTDKTIYGGAIALTGSAIVIGGSMLFVREYGIIAPAFAMLACFVVMCCLAWLVSRRFFPVDYPLGRITLYAGLASLAVYLGAGAQDAMWIRIAVFAALLLILGLLERRWIVRTFLT